MSNIFSLIKTINTFKDYVVCSKCPPFARTQKQRLIEVWCGLEQSTVDMAIDQWRKRLRACVRAKGGHLEHSL